MTDQSAGSTQEDVVNVPQSWARDGHVVRDPRIWPVIRAGIATLIADLEAAKPASLDGMRRRFCEMPRLDDAVAIPRLLEARFELLQKLNCQDFDDVRVARRVAVTGRAGGATAGL
jgi:hypothetical protein